MIADIWTVMWKEWKGLFRQRGSRTRALWILFTPLVMVGIFLPWQIGHGWVESYWSLIASVFIPPLLVGTTIPESFAGERERHTLGTLLASRLPDRAILFGKVAVSIGYGWGIALLSLLLGLLTVNIAHWDGQVVLFAPSIALANVALSLIMACFMAGLGVLISLRCATVQGATMILMAATFLPLIALQIVGVVFIQVASGGRERIMNIFASVNPTQIILIAVGVLVAASLGLFWAAMARFKRARLMLD